MDRQKYPANQCPSLTPARAQAKKHQDNLRKRAAEEEARVEMGPEPLAQATTATRRSIRIGCPGYRVVRQRDASTGQRSLLFEVSFPDIDDDAQPRHRFMSAFEQRKEVPDKTKQYLLFAAEPYETVAFKIPADPIDRREGRFFTDWNPTTKLFRLQFFFRDAPPSSSSSSASAAAGVAVSAT